MINKPWNLHAASEQLIARQMRLWEASFDARRAASESDQPELAESICISRQVGAGGFHVATKLAAKLNWALFDRELLQAMAGEDAVRKHIYASLDERDLSWFEEALRSFADPQFVRNDYFHQLTRTVLSLARLGNAVFLGRGTQFIIPRQACLAVRIVAPVSDRVTAFANISDLTEIEAIAEIERIEGERSSFILTHFGKSVDDPTSYDLILNSAQLDTDHMADLILAARTARLESGKTPSAIAQAKLAQSIKEASC